MLTLNGELALLAGDTDAALQAFEAAKGATQSSSWPQTLVDLYGPDPAPDVRIAQRIEWLREDVDQADHWPDDALELALLHWHQRDEVAAFAALDRAVVLGFRDAAYLASSPLFATIRTHASYPALAQRVRALAADERDVALAASWWRPELMSADGL